jgi:hypothetical protein
METESWGQADEQWTALAVRRWPTLGRCPEALEWLRIQTNLRLAPRSLEAYARGLADYLTVCFREQIDPLNAERAEERPSSRSTQASGSRTPPSTSGWWWSGSSMTI